MNEIEWNKEPESTHDKNEHGYLHFKGTSMNKEVFELRFDFKKGTDVWTLEYLPTNRIWTRDGIVGDKTLKGLAKSYLKSF